MTNLRDVLIRPLITEKSNAGMQENKYTFIVPLNANKVEIRQAVESVWPTGVARDLGERRDCNTSMRLPSAASPSTRASASVAKDLIER